MSELEKLIQDIKALGIYPGDRLFVHSSFRSLKLKHEGPETVIHALRHCVDEQGTIGMPTFTYSFSPESCFNIQTSQSRVGVITEVFRKQAGVIRSISPSHSVAFLGKDADVCARSMDGLPPYSMTGPFGKLYVLDFKILMIGCGLGPNSTLHAVEHWAELPYYRNATETCYSVSDKGFNGRNYPYMPVGHRDFYVTARDSFKSKYAKLLQERELLSSGTIGCAKVYCMSARDLVDTCMKELDRRPTLFLCDNSECASCQAARYDFDIWQSHGGTRWFHG